MKVNRMITKVNRTVPERPRKIEFIVVHYFGALNSAEGNAKYFYDTYRGASAHYFVGKDVWQVVEDEHVAWHCGGAGNGALKNVCTNSNSLAIEIRPEKVDKSSLLATDTDWYFDEDVLDLAVELIKTKQEEYGIEDDKVVRHFDVTGKHCPRPFVGSDVNTYYNQQGWFMWKNFRERLKEEDMTQAQFNKFMDTYLDELKRRDPSVWSEDARNWAEDEGVIIGDETGDKQYKMFVTREQMVIFLKRIHSMLGSR